MRKFFLLFFLVAILLAAMIGVLRLDAPYGLVSLVAAAAAAAGLALLVFPRHRADTSSEESAAPEGGHDYPPRLAGPGPRMPGTERRA